MTKRGMRGFAAGILITCAVIAFFYYQIIQPAKNDQTSSDKVLSSKNINKYLLDHHLVAVNQKQFNEWQNAKQHKESNPDKNNGKVIYRTILYITEGMTTVDIANTLADYKIIKNKEDLLDYLRSHHLEEKIQPGHYNLGSNMSIGDIVNKITK
ncbi:hypothetical protein [Scopulibacillus cellulosilyticus]|uniref:YceG-like family protein n=1 Tax=Scopulibacillus cellulosilyticus TaxID=2665665 RepID=A0ABW2Q133_9BACL